MADKKPITRSATGSLQELAAADTLSVAGFKLTTDPTDGFVLTSDAAGVGTWQSGAASRTQVSHSTNQTLTDAEQTVLYTTSGGDRTATLPSSHTSGNRILIKKITTANSLTIGRNGNNIDNAASDEVIPSGSLGWVWLESDGTNWWVIGRSG